MEIRTRSRGSNLGIVPQSQISFEYVDVEAESQKETLDIDEKTPIQVVLRKCCPRSAFR